LYAIRSIMLKKHLINEKLIARHKEVRLISPNGKNLGLMSSVDALKLARQFNLDLIELNGNITPPICKIDDLGKLMYQEGKRNDSKPSSPRPKEIDLSARIEQNDFDIKVNRAKEFLKAKHQIKLILKFRGREMAHKEIGFGIVRRAVD